MIFAGLKHIFFDFDGTLVDSAGDIRTVLRRTLAHDGLLRDDFEARFRVGPPLPRLIAALAPSASSSQIEAAVRRFRADYAQCGFPLTVPYLGVDEMLKSLSGKGVRMSICTNKPLGLTRAIVDKLHWHCFDDILTPDFFEAKVLSKAELLQVGLTRQGVDAAVAAMVGDTVDDLVAARTNGMMAVAVTWGYGDIANLKAEKSQAIINEPSMIEKLFLNQQ